MLQVLMQVQRANATTALKSGKNQQPSVLESEHEAIANLESKADRQRLSLCLLKV